MSEEPLLEVHALAELQSAFDATFAVSPGSRNDREPVIQIRVGSETLAVRTSHIAGLVKSRKVVPLPGGIPELLGVAALRGALIPVYDLAALLGIPTGGIGTSWLILSPGDTPIGLAFEGFEGQHEPEWLCDENTARQHVRQLVRTGPATLAVVDIPGLVDAVRKRAGITDPAKERKQ